MVLWFCINYVLEEGDLSETILTVSFLMALIILVLNKLFFKEYFFLIPIADVLKLYLV